MAYESTDERIERLQTEFNAAATQGAPVRLHDLTSAGSQDVVAFMSTQNSESYHPLISPGSVSAFSAARYKKIEVLDRVMNVKLVDSAGKALSIAPHDLSGCFLTFDVRGIANGDVYRVEVLPDPEIGGFTEQIRAGVHTNILQSFQVPLSRESRRVVEISIYRVDAEAARRDENISRPKEWIETYDVR